MLSKISKKIFNSERISIEEGIWLLKESELLDLIPLADHWRTKHNPNKNVTYVVDTNLNYTNICNTIVNHKQPPNRRQLQRVDKYTSMWISIA